MGSQWSIALRPTKLENVYGIDHIKKFFNNRIKEEKEIPTALLFKGQTGCGKTTVAKIIAMRLLCNHTDLKTGEACGECENCKSILQERYNSGNILFIDGATAGKDDIIDPIKEFFSSPPMPGSRNKVIFIDECQELSTAAVKTMLKVLETPKKNLYCILTSMGNTDGAVKSGSGKEVPKSIESRCQLFQFKKAETVQIMSYLKSVMEKQGLWSDDSIPKEFKLQGLQTIADSSYGSFRYALQTLEQCIDAGCYTQKEMQENFGLVDQISFYDMMLRILDGKPDDNVFETMIEGDWNTLFSYAYKVVSDAICYRTFKKIPGDVAYFTQQAATLAKHPKFSILMESYQRMSELSVPYLKKSDYIIGICQLIQKCQGQEQLKENVVEQRRVVKR